MATRDGDPMDMTAWNARWPVLKTYAGARLDKVAMPLGGVGAGGLTLGGRGRLRDWEIRNRPAKGYAPTWRTGAAAVVPFFAIRARAGEGAPVLRVIEGPLPPSLYEGAAGCPVPVQGLPRFRDAAFAAAFPLGQVAFSRDGLPFTARLEAFSPFIPCDPERSGFPAAVLRVAVDNPGREPLDATLCGTLVNPGLPGASPVQARRSAPGLQGLVFSTEGGDPAAEAAGELVLAALAEADEVSARTRWTHRPWGGAWSEFVESLLTRGRLDEAADGAADSPAASLCVRRTVPAGGSADFTFLIAWRYPNRRDWRGGARVGNHYAVRFPGAWEAAAALAGDLPALERDTVRFVRAVAETPLPAEVREAALFNLSTLASPTCFRTADGHFLGWEGCSDSEGCCEGSCTHVWNYETALPFLFGSLSRSMREVAFLYATDARGLMSFRALLPLGEKGTAYGKASADGQMGALMRLYLDWKLSGDDAWVARLWPAAKRALAFAWIPGGWDADRDGVMEGCQHNTMDVEYFGPNPQMGIWYLGALLACAELAEHLGDKGFEDTCRRLYERGRPWLMRRLFNGDYFDHHIRPPADPEAIAEGLRVGSGAPDPKGPDYQLGPGCLVDQLVGQVFAHLAGLNYLLPPENITRTLSSIFRYNFRKGFHDHVNPMRGYAMGDEAGLLMATYPRGNRPAVPFPYADEVVTGFEYTAACGMLLEGMTAEGLACIAAIRDRYDGLKRNPFDEAECGHHYARALMSWTVVPALTGFRYDATQGRMQWGTVRGPGFWSTGSAWGVLDVRDGEEETAVRLEVCGGALRLRTLEIAKAGTVAFERSWKAGDSAEARIPRKKRNG